MAADDVETTPPPPPSSQFCQLQDRAQSPLQLSRTSTSHSSKQKTPERILHAAKPTRVFFDPWNTASTGHQRAENRLAGSLSWRQSRTLKLAHQLSDETGSGGKRLADTVGAGSTEFGKDGRLENGGWERGASGLRTGGQLSLQECFSRNGRRPQSPGSSEGAGFDEGERLASATNHVFYAGPAAGSAARAAQTAKELPEEEEEQVEQQPRRQIFRNLTIYINGSTYPFVSDHKLKKLLRIHGANISLALGRRSVTHVLIGTPNDPKAYTGAGGGLAASKIQREVTAVRAKGVKFVSAQWVMDSIEAGTRLPEHRYACLKLSASNQQGVREAFGG